MGLEMAQVQPGMLLPLMAVAGTVLSQEAALAAPTVAKVVELAHTVDMLAHLETLMGMHLIPFFWALEVLTPLALANLAQAGEQCQLQCCSMSQLRGAPLYLRMEGQSPT